MNQKKEDFRSFNSFGSVSDGRSYFQTKFVFGVHKYIDIYVNNPEYIVGIPYELFQLSQIKHLIRTEMLKIIRDRKITLNFDDVESMCQDFFGRGQHIILEKNWGSLLLSKPEGN